LRSWKFWIGVAISAIFVYWTASGLVDWASFWTALRQAQYWWLIPGIVVYFCAVWARTWRWHYMLRHMAEVPLRHLFPIVVIGYMGNNIYPARAGEIIRSYVLKRNEQVSISASLATVALERLFDGLVMCVFVFATLPFVSLPAVYRMLVIGFSTLFFIALIIFLLLAARPERTNLLAARIIARVVPSRIRPRVSDLAAKFIRGLESLRSPREVLMIFLTSVAIWLTETTKYWFVMHAFPFEVSFPVLMLMTAVVNLFTTIPSAPGYVGTFDAPGIEVLKSFGVAASTAAAYTIVLHVALWLPVTLLGLFYMSRASLRWRDIDVAVDESHEGGNLERRRADPSSLVSLVVLLGAAMAAGFAGWML
jgi:hypothetical protein